VENAILHGLRQNGGGQIFISGYGDGEHAGIRRHRQRDWDGAEMKHFLNSVLDLEQLE